MATKLAGAIATAAADKPPAAHRFAAAIASARPLKPIKIPGLEVTALLTLIGTERALDIEADVTRAMLRRGLPETQLNGGIWELERARHVLAEAVLDDDPEKRTDPPPIGTLADWGKLPKETIAALWSEYDDLSQEHDPADVALTDDERLVLAAAIEKKSVPLLRSFGAKRLTAWLLTTAAPPASSPTAESSPGDSSPAS